MFVKNLWYAAAWSDEIVLGVPLMRTLLDQPILFWRNEAGIRAVFKNEDKPIIERQQRRLVDVDLFERAPALLAIDNASTRARRRYAALLAGETAASRTSKHV